MKTKNILIISIAIVLIICVGVPLILIGLGAKSTPETIKETMSHFADVLFKNNSEGISLVVSKDSSKPELVTLTRGFEFEYKYSTTWAGSTKTIIVKNSFEAKAGMNLALENPLVITIPNEKSATISIHNAKGKLISCSPKGEVTVVTDESGWWNKSTKDDRIRAVNMLQKAAEEHILETGILSEAEENFRLLIQKSANSFAKDNSYKVAID